jgi:hypothetical protein
MFHDSLAVRNSVRGDPQLQTMTCGCACRLQRRLEETEAQRAALEASVGSCLDSALQRLAVPELPRGLPDKLAALDKATSQAEALCQAAEQVKDGASR